MQLARVVFAITALFTAYTYAAAPARRSTTDITKRAGNATEPTLDPKVLSHLSTWFGWQYAGAAKDSNELSEPCTNINSTGGKKWAEIGLVPANIQKPLCNASHGSPDPEQAFPNSIPAISAMVGRQLVGSFNGTKSFAYLCDHLAGFQIDHIYLTDAKLLEAVCKKAGQQVPPRPFNSGEGGRVSEAAGFAARNTASILYATILAAGAESGLQLNVLCAHAPNHIDNLNTEKLNGTLVESTLCSFKAPLEKSEAQSKILSWTSRLFITVLENIGQGDDWLGWLCEHLSVEGMNSVGVIGWGSQQLVCTDARIGLPTEPVMPTGIPVNLTNGS